MTPLAFNYPVSVAILYYAGSGGDMEDTVEAVGGMAKALEERGHMVRAEEVTTRNWRRATRVPGEVVFNLVEDEQWRLYLAVGQRLEEMGRAQVGHDMSSFKYATKKARIKRRMVRLGISTPRFRVFNRRTRKAAVRGLTYPLIVKPSGQHAGIGISQDSVVIDDKELAERVAFVFRHFPGEVVAEEFIDGREIHVTVVGNGRQTVAMPACEIEFGGEFVHNWDVYTYEAKWEKASWEYWGARVEAPARVDRMLGLKLDKLALRAYSAFGCRDVARLDMRVDEKDRVYVVDINMNPSLNRYDDQDATIKSVEAVGWSYEDFMETLIAVTYKRVYGRLPDRVRERSFLLALPGI